MIRAPWPTQARMVSSDTGAMPAPREHVVKRVGQVRRGIDQGAVEIEHDGGVLEHGALSHTRLAAWQAAA